jgi:hypothetical protein
MLVTMKALRSVDTYDKSITTTVNEGTQQCTYDDLKIEEDIKFDLSGNYSLQITKCVIEKTERGEDIYPHWKTNLNGMKNNNYKFRLHPHLVTAILNRVNDMDITDVNNVYTQYQRLYSINHNISRWQSSNISCQLSHPGQNVVRLKKSSIGGKQYLDYL